MKPDCDKLRERVERGAQLLDRLEPDWFKVIDPEYLDMEKCSRCILGQLHGDYFHSPVYEQIIGMQADPDEYGFDVFRTPGYDHYDLREAWLDELRRRI